MRKLDETLTAAIIHALTSDTPPASIATLWQVSPATVYRIARDHGIKTAKRKQTKKRTYAGNPPTLREGFAPGGEGYERLGEITTQTGGVWEVYSRGNTEKPAYRTVKLCTQKPAENKGNYWLSYHVPRGVLTPTRDGGLLKQNRPELYQALIDFLKKYYENA